MKFNVKDANNEMAELKLTQLFLARVLDNSQGHISQVLLEAKEPTDDFVRRLYAVFLMVRGEHLKSGGFALTTKNARALKLRLDQMDRSIVRGAGRASTGKACSSSTEQSFVAIGGG